MEYIGYDIETAIKENGGAEFLKQLPEDDNTNPKNKARYYLAESCVLAHLFISELIELLLKDDKDNHQNEISKLFAKLGIAIRNDQVKKSLSECCGPCLINLSQRLSRKMLVPFKALISEIKVLKDVLYGNDEPMNEYLYYTMEESIIKKIGEFNEIISSTPIKEKFVPYDYIAICINNYDEFMSIDTIHELKIFFKKYGHMRRIDLSSSEPIL